MCSIFEGITWDSMKFQLRNHIIIAKWVRGTAQAVAGLESAKNVLCVWSGCWFVSLCEFVLAGLCMRINSFIAKCSKITIIPLIILFIRGQLFPGAAVFFCVALRCYSQLFIPFYSHSSRFDFMKRIFSDFILLYNVFNVRVYHNHKLSHKMLFGGMLSGTISSLLHICPVFICCAPVSTHIHKSSWRRKTECHNKKESAM